MGMTILRSSGTFDPTDHGLTAGTIINVVVVGGGASGGVIHRVSTTTTTIQTTGNAGESSSFGSYVTALGGAYPTQGNGIGGAYGLGAGGWYPGVIASVIPSTITTASGPYDTLGAVYNYISIYGGGPLGMLSTAAVEERIVRGCPGRLNGIGADGAVSCIYNATGSSYTCYAGGGGAGYGAGGGGASYQYSHSSSYSCAISYLDILGGNSGEVKEATIKLESTDPIAVTVGKGGTGAVCTKSATVQSGAGADGCVCIFW